MIQEKADQRLLEAARDGNLGDAIRALNEGAAINARDVHERTPLHLASMGGHTEIIRLLIEERAEERAEVNARDYREQTPLHFATWGGHVEIGRLLIEEAGANPSLGDQWESTPLHWAAKKGDVNFVGLLMKNGADRNASDILGQTPKDYATDNGHTDLAMVLEPEGYARRVIERRSNDTLRIDGGR